MLVKTGDGFVAFTDDNEIGSCFAERSLWQHGRVAAQNKYRERLLFQCVELLKEPEHADHAHGAG